MRLTYKINGKEYAPCKNTGWKTFDKLGQLEDIEEELGIDLITLFKVLTDGIYRKTKYDITFYNPSSMSITKTPNFGWALYHRSYTRLFPKDYGKTWALTKEELL